MDTRQAHQAVITISGTPEEMGRAQAEAIRNIPGWLSFLRSAPEWISRELFAPLLAGFEQACPGTAAEIQSFAEALELPAHRVFYYPGTFLRSGHCSHMAVLPPATKNGHVLAARSYEFGDRQNDFRFCITRPAGRYAHIGTTSLLFGRLEGLNEHGLCVTMSAGGMPIGNDPALQPPACDGLHFWALIRALLENCRTVDEALERTLAFPNAANPTLILSDRQGNAALVETLGRQMAIKRCLPGGSEHWLAATNHYTLPDMLPYRKFFMANSPVRLARMQTVLAEHAPHIDIETLQALLSAPYPEGLCAHYYDEFFGTVHSMIFDLTAGEVEVCFGSPQANGWHSFNFDSSTPAVQFPVTLPLEQAPRSFWVTD